MAGVDNGKPLFFYKVAIRLGIKDLRLPVARKLISSAVVSISPDDQSLPVLQISLQEEPYV